MRAQTSGSVAVYNSGGYVARFSVSFNLNGNRITYNSGDFPAAQGRTLEIPYGTLKNTINSNAFYTFFTFFRWVLWAFTY